MQSNTKESDPVLRELQKRELAYEQELEQLQKRESALVEKLDQVRQAVAALTGLARPKKSQNRKPRSQKPVPSGTVVLATAKRIVSERTVRTEEQLDELTKSVLLQEGYSRLGVSRHLKVMLTEGKLQIAQSSKAPAE
ncbi:MAG: hypothetical protein AAGG44_12525 [Planctomycetota bacterium]